jgi:hypothetical protein
MASFELYGRHFLRLALFLLQRRGEELGARAEQGLRLRMTLRVRTVIPADKDPHEGFQQAEPASCELCSASHALQVANPSRVTLLEDAGGTEESVYCGAHLRSRQAS